MGEQAALILEQQTTIADLKQKVEQLEETSEAQASQLREQARAIQGAHEAVASAQRAMEALQGEHAAAIADVPALVKEFAGLNNAPAQARRQLL